MTEPPLYCWKDAFARRFGSDRPVAVYARTTSTQDVARRMIGRASAAEAAALTGTVIVASEQTHGRGRLGRPWLAPAGTAVTFSYLLPVQSTSVDQLTFAAAVGLARATDRWLKPAGRQCRLKWPNDVHVERRKLAGILVETCGPLAIVGVGYNVGVQPGDLPSPLTDTATSLAMCGIATQRLAVWLDLVEAIDHAIFDTPEAELLKAWREHCGMFDQVVRLGCDGQTYEGHIIDLHPREGLILRRMSGEIVNLPAATTTVLV